MLTNNSYANKMPNDACQLHCVAIITLDTKIGNSRLHQTFFLNANIHLTSVGIQKDTERHFKIIYNAICKAATERLA